MERHTPLHVVFLFMEKWYADTMLNPFPSLLAFSLLAPLLVRVTLGLTFVHLAYGVFLHHKRMCRLLVSLGVLAALGGIALVIGLFTQIASLLAACISLVFFLFPKQVAAPFGVERRLSLILFVLSLSLLFSGAGLFAFDLPL